MRPALARRGFFLLSFKKNLNVKLRFEAQRWGTLHLSDPHCRGNYTGYFPLCD